MFLVLPSFRAPEQRRQVILLRRLAIVRLSELLAPLVGSSGLVAGTLNALEAPPVAQLCRPPMQFEPNQGQAACGVDYLSRGPGYAVCLRASQASLSLSPATRPTSRQGSGSDRNTRRISELQMNLLQAN